MIHHDKFQTICPKCKEIYSLGQEHICKPGKREGLQFFELNPDKEHTITFLPPEFALHTFLPDHFTAAMDSFGIYESSQQCYVGAKCYVPGECPFCDLELEEIYLVEMQEAFLAV